jgi:hypothetical protein
MRLLKSKLHLRANIIGAFFCLGLIAGSAFAQNRQTESSHSQAALTIRINVAPVIASPQAQLKNAHSTDVTYNIPITPMRLSVTEAIEQELVANPSGERQYQMVETTTIVPE